MQSVMNHARNFNNLLIEVEAYGYTVDETIVLSSHNDLYFFRSWRHVECHHRVVAPFCNSRLLRKCQLPLNTVDCLITSYLACGTVVPRLTPPSVMSRVIDGVNTHCSCEEKQIYQGFRH
jgi:hypothetical protein